ncbi:MAG: hypothetical protein ACR2IS_02225 [Nitrososphaeraceae archaeon]
MHNATNIVVDILKIIGIGLWLVASLCIYLLTTQVCSTIYAQEDKRFTNAKSSSNEIHPKVFPTAPLSIEAFSENKSRSNISLTDGAAFSSSNPLFLKFNNLNNNHNKAGSTSFSDSRGSINPPSAYVQPFPSPNTYPYYYPSSNYYPYSSGTSPYPPLTSPTSYSSPQSSTPYSSTLAPTSSASPSAYSASSGLSGQPYFLPAPPPPLFPPPRYPYELIQDASSRNQASVGPQESKLVSPWFPSIPASDCEGIFEFTIEGTADLQSKNLKSGNHSITIKMTSDSPGAINGQMWVDKKNINDKGSKFDVDKTFNNCRVVTASSVPPSTGQPSIGEQESSSLLNSLLNDLPDEDQFADEPLTDETSDTVSSQQEEDFDDGDDTKRNGNKIASLE